jgi:hypothetical protein
VHQSAVKGGTPQSILGEGVRGPLQEFGNGSGMPLNGSQMNCGRPFATWTVRGSIGIRHVSCHEQSIENFYVAALRSEMSCRHSLHIFQNLDFFLEPP